MGRCGNLILFATTLALLAAITTGEPDSRDPWAPVTEAIDKYNIRDFAVSVTNSSGIVYLHEKGKISFTNTVMNVASTTKWVSGTMILRVVASGKLRLNDYCHDWFPYWTKDPRDPRSRIQLKHLLSFTSGYYQLTYGASVPCFRDPDVPYLDCVKELYDTVPLKWEPGTVWDYSSLHLKIAGGMAIMASGQDINTLINDTLASLGMKNSYYDHGVNPELAGSLWTTGEDYNRFLELLYYEKALPWDIVEAMETDHTPNGQVKASKKSWGLAAAVGHYGLANWSPECFLNKPADLRDTCYERSIHTSPGVFGYYPLIHRNHRYWMQVVYDGPAVIGCIDGWAARGVLLPLVDAVMQGIPHSHIHVPTEEEINDIKDQLRSLLDVDLLRSYPN